MDLIKGLLSSKKFIAAIIGVIITLASRYGLNLDPAVVQEVAAIFITYLIAQGISDHGKEAARIAAVATSASPPVPGAAEAMSQIARDVQKDT